ncbi:hypothetical protein [Cohnella nanjingensis]|uniref:Uncharacterized protein n=1 Tax=Cohnella nanjingensis TaxID=1387779 RepID=A0A7X0VDP2_9BACL|nr:hypothetical protein [Cohnella nanjingensis]MBB6669443.1 hypothetical protein [Cohnella nanjingensis]
MTRHARRIVLGIAATAALLAGCASKPEAQAIGPLPSASHAPPSHTAIASPSKETASPSPSATVPPSEDQAGEVALQWQRVTEAPAISQLSDWPSKGQRTIREYKLKAHPGMKIVVYAWKENADNLYAALKTKTVVYDLGIIGKAAYGKAEDITVEDDVVAFRQKLVKVTGTLGASASLTRYLSIDQGVPKPVLAVDAGRASELDLDFDGVREIVATSGTPMKTYVYRWNEDRIERCDLNEALGAPSVSISPESAVVAEFSPDLVKLYWLEPSKMRQFAQYNAEEYRSDRFVTIPYDAGELQEIQEAVAQIDLATPYAPARGIATDYGIQSTVEKQAGTMQLSYPHFGIKQSKHDLRPGKGAQVRKTVKLAGGEASWIETAPGSGAWYLKRGDTYLSIMTAKPFSADQLLFVAASLVPASDIHPAKQKG